MIDHVEDKNSWFWGLPENEGARVGRAEIVMQALLETIPSTFDPDCFESYSSSKSSEINKLIRKNIDANSIWHFVYLAGVFHESVKAKLRAAHRLNIDPKQAAKKEVRDCWELWQADKKRYRSKAAFSRDMLSKYECLDNAKVIERWCKQWEQEPN